MRYYLIGLLFLLFLHTSSFAQYSNVKFDHLSLKDGLSQSEVLSITQDYRGLMWFGTQDGLNKYDGFSFTIYSHNLNDSNSIANNFIHTIYQSNDSMLWLGTENGLSIFDKSTQKFTNIKLEKNGSKLENETWSILEDKNNTKWVVTNTALYKITDNLSVKKIKLNLITNSTKLKAKKAVLINDTNLLIATEGNGLIEYDIKTKKTTQFTTDNSYLNSNFINDIFISLDNTAWLATKNGVITFSSAQENFAAHPLINQTISSQAVQTIFQDKSGIFWIGTENFGLFRLNGNVIDHYTANLNVSTSVSSNKINTIFQDKAGILWIGTQAGVDKLDKQKQFFKHYQHWDNISNTLSSNMVWSIFKGDNNVLYVGTDQGLDVFDRTNGTVLNITPINKNQNNSVYCIYQNRNHEILLGTEEGVYKFLNKQLIKLAIPNNKYRTYNILEDSKGRYWFATKEGLVLYNKQTSQSIFFNANDSVNKKLTADVVRVVYEDKNRSIWLGVDGGGLGKVIEKNDQVFFKFYEHQSQNKNSLSNNTVLSIVQDVDGTLWVGTYGGGLNKFNPETEKFKHYTQHQGLQNNVVYGVINDRKGNLWLSTNRGISKFDKKRERFRIFDESDGLQSNEFNTGAYFISRDNEIFFGGINGFNAFYAEDISLNTTQPEIVITNFYLFNKKVEINPNGVLPKNISELDNITLKYRQNVLSFEFASLHYSQPKNNQHAYKLEPFDKEWVYIGNNRRANYTNLDPGEYIFKVKGSNGDGVWGENIAQIKILVKPPFWATWWFRMLVVLLILSFIYAYYITRINRVKAQKLLLEVQVRERTHEMLLQKEEIEKQKKRVEEEKDKAEKLLLNILPQETADELKAKGKATARHYRLVSVMFTDFKSFTKIAEDIRPQDLVAKLDSYFIKFDEIIEKYNIEKIKTIGDAYMCAGGIPIRNKSNPIDVVLAGLEIQRFVKEYNKKINNDWELRIGIHTGELIAGVIGIKRFAYDIWGDSVNIASRIEASGAVNKVNVSGRTYELVKEFFVCEYRGKIEAKNKGEIDMYYVTAIKPELSVNGEGNEPNDLFYKYVDLHIYSGINYRKAEKYIINRLEKELPSNLYYHDINHTRDVCAAVERLALMEGIEGDDIFLLKTAALYHDAGFVKQYSNNEDIGAELAAKVLPRFGYTSEQIKTIARLISATKIPHNPSDHLEQIICDADLDYLGTDEFHFTADKLKKELIERDIVQNDVQWDELQIKFLESHKYFTKTAIKLRKENKLARIEEIKERLQILKTKKG